MERRKRRRLAGFDYAQAGAYFVTINAADRACLFGAVADGEMRLNTLGEAVAASWSDLPRSVPAIELDEWVLMPNHFHGLVFLPPRSVHSLADIMRVFKSTSARAANRVRGSSGSPLWHRSYYDHIVRNETDLNRIRQYIADNPARWDQDENNPEQWPPSVEWVGSRPPGPGKPGPYES